MRRIDRTAVSPPACLSAFHHSTHGWHDVLPCKPAIRKALAEIQESHCAYCEGPLRAESHFEHFRRKNPDHFPELTFEWTNLFLCCSAREHCAWFKDRPKATAYDPADLVKPDEENPDDSLYYHHNGEVRPRTGASRPHRASCTIAVLNLNHVQLKAARAQAVRRYWGPNGRDLEELMTWSAEDRRAYLCGEDETLRTTPFATTIRHFLMAS